MKLFCTQVLAITITLFMGATKLNAAIIGLQNATATYSQTSDGVWNVEQAIDGLVIDSNGWAVLNGGNEIAVFESVANFGYAGGTLLTFKLHQEYSNMGHLLGAFRISVTQADRSTFADGLQNGGDVGSPAIWTQLVPTFATSSNGATLSINGDNSILSGGINPGVDIYTVIASTSLDNITGVRLEVFQDPSLPRGGPGRFENGNFVLTEFTLDASPAVVPEPGTFILFGSGLVGLLGYYRKRKTIV